MPELLSTGLVTVDCPHCQGEGCLLAQGGPGRYSPRSGSYLPDEDALCCETCGGSGVQEVCARCREPLRVLHGQEVCGCAAEAMRRAA